MNIDIDSLNLYNESDDPEKTVVTDPTGRFERTNVLLGRGAYKEVYKAFDQEEGVEVAWNQLIVDHLTKKDVTQILSEIGILESLRNDNIINFFYSWSAKGKDNKDRIFFITELMTSGTLKSYISKTLGQIKPKVLKTWCRQILNGLHYLHSREIPIIHRDLKCDNIFINGNNGQAKIGDLGLATFKRKDNIASVIGTPEFMAPELYDEKYDETVDIYAFGMCVLEIVTKEYPYSECSNAAQIFRKVTTGVKPQSLSKVPNKDTLAFIELCIDHDPKKRPSCAQLLDHPFLNANAHVDSPDDSARSGRLRRSLSLPLMPKDVTDLKLLDEHFKDAKDTKQRKVRRNTSRVDKNAAKAAVQQINSPSQSYCDIEIIPNPDTMKTNVVIMKMNYAKLDPSSNGTNTKKNEIKFPFHLLNDTANSVVLEMIRENILPISDKVLAEERIQEAVRIATKMLTKQLSTSSLALSSSASLNTSTASSLSSISNTAPPASSKPAETPIVLHFYRRSAELDQDPPAAFEISSEMSSTSESEVKSAATDKKDVRNTNRFSRSSSGNRYGLRGRHGHRLNLSISNMENIQASAPKSVTAVEIEVKKGDNEERGRTLRRNEKDEKKTKDPQLSKSISFEPLEGVKPNVENDGPGTTLSKNEQNTQAVEQEKSDMKSETDTKGASDVQEQQESKQSESPILRVETGKVVEQHRKPKMLTPVNEWLPEESAARDNSSQRNSTYSSSSPDQSIEEFVMNAPEMKALIEKYERDREQLNKNFSIQKEQLATKLRETFISTLKSNAPVEKKVEAKKLIEELQSRALSGFEMDIKRPSNSSMTSNSMAASVQAGTGSSRNSMVIDTTFDPFEWNPTTSVSLNQSQTVSAMTSPAADKLESTQENNLIQMNQDLLTPTTDEDNDSTVLTSRILNELATRKPSGESQ